jgi:amidase
VNEGGGIHVDGEGTVLLTDTVQLDPRRNPYADRARVEAESPARSARRRRSGCRAASPATTTISARTATSTSSRPPLPGSRPAAHQRDPGHPDHAVTRELREILAAQTDAAGRRLEIVDLPAPRHSATRASSTGATSTTSSTNDGVIACGFGEPADAEAAAHPRRCLPGPRGRDRRRAPIFARGGGIHCITQQQPRVAPRGCPMIDVVDASIAELRAARDRRTTAVELVEAYLARIDAYDGPTPRPLSTRSSSAIPTRRGSRGIRRAAPAGHALGPLDGIPYTAKDSYLVRGLTAAAGSPPSPTSSRSATPSRSSGCARVARSAWGSRTCRRWRTGMQRGVYGRAESPYNADWLPLRSARDRRTAPARRPRRASRRSASARRRGRADAARLEQRAVRLHPSRGVISTRGNWPLVPTMDVVVPQTRTMADLLEVLDVVVADDPDTRGDFWRTQPWIALPDAAAVRPRRTRLSNGASVRGMRLGIPRMYINADPLRTGPASAGRPGSASRPARRSSRCGSAHGGPRGRRGGGRRGRLPGRLELRGRPARRTDDRDRGLVSPEYLRREIVDLSAWAWEDFLAANGDPAFHTSRASTARASSRSRTARCPTATRVRGRHRRLPRLGAHAPGGRSVADHARTARRPPRPRATRRIDLEEWMDDLGLDAVVFPAVADVGPATMDVTRMPPRAAGATASGSRTATSRSVTSASRP